MEDEYKPQLEEAPEDDNFLCVEKTTGYVYQAKPLGEDVIARPVSPQLYGFITRLSREDFDARFEEFLGNYKEVMKYVTGE